MIFSPLPLIRRTGATVAILLATAAAAAASAIPVWCGQALLLGTSDGAEGSSLFYHPSSIAVDASGNVYVADTGASTVRKIGPGGIVSTLAGQPIEPGSADGTGASAQFFEPEAISVGPDGTIYLADTGNDTIRKITPSGSVTTWAGLAGSPGSADGPGSVASFNQPKGLAVDGAGNVYVADTASSTIRKIGPDGTVSTLAGLAGAEGSVDGPASTARFSHPRGLALDTLGNLYVADTGNNTIRQIALDGTVTTAAGQPGVAGSADGLAAAAQFSEPVGVAVDGAGVLYVADSGNSAIRMVSASGVVSTYFSSTTSSDPTAVLCAPTGVAVDLNGNVYFADTYNDVIRLATAAAAAGATFPSFGPTQDVSASPAPTAPVLGSTTGTASGSAGSASNTTGTTTGSAGSASNITGPAGSPSNAASGGSQLSSSNSGGIASTASRIVNLSAMAMAGPGAEGLDAGFVIGGQGSKSILVRAVGPTLAQFGVTGVLSEPELTLSGAEGAIATAGAWGGSQSLSQTFAAVGAFALPANSLDAASVDTLGAGLYTVAISGAAGSGLALAEIYDADATNTGTNLTNLSVRAYVGSGAAEP
jgi:sugar lactone lactonase YvrE